MISSAGMTRVRDLFTADITHGQLGTGDTNPAITDTDLETPVAATKLAPTINLGVNSFNLVHVINTTVGNGSTYTEQGSFMNTTTLLNRNVFSPLTKSNVEEYTILTTFNLVSI